MAEENQNVEQQVQENTPDQQETPEVTQTEQLAREQGWVPRDDFDGDEHRWVDAGEFLRRGELFKKIDSQSRELKEVKAVMAQFKEHHKKVSEAAYKKALNDLKAEKKEALLEGDADRVVELDEQMAIVREEQTRAAQQEQRPEPQGEHPEFTNWKSRNSWYENNTTMRSVADIRGAELARLGHSPARVLELVEQEIRAEFAHKFTNPNKGRPGATESPVRGNPGAAKNKYQPTDLERSMAKRFVREGLFKNEQEYYDELGSM